MSSDKKTPDMNEKTQQPELTPQQVSASFVRQYYATLAQDPANFHRFYKEESSFTHLTLGEHEEAVTGLENIKKKIEELEYKGNSVSVRLTVIDVQKSLNGCFLVVVQGNISKDSGRTYKPFSQSFCLAPQSPKGYYVLNDVCRYMTDEPKQSKMAEEEQDASDVVSNAATAGRLSTQSSNSDELNHVEEKPKEEQPKPQPKEKKQKQKQKQKAAQQKKESKEKQAPVAETEPKKDDGPKTYASVVGGEGYVAPQPQQEEKKKKRNKKQRKKAEEKVEEKTEEGQDEKQKKKFFKKGEQQERRRQNGRQYAHAIYITNIPEGLKNEDLIAKFEDCGKVLDASLHYKGDVNYGFVYFETEEGVINAVKPDRKFVINNVTLSVEKRKSRPRRRFWRGGRRGGREGQQDRREFRKRNNEKGEQRKPFKKTGQQGGQQQKTQ